MVAAVLKSILKSISKRHFKVQICEYLDISYLTRKQVKIDSSKLTEIQGHILCFICLPSFEDFSILTKERNEFKLKTIDSLLIARGKLFLTKQIHHCL